MGTLVPFDSTPHNLGLDALLVDDNTAIIEPTRRADAVRQAHRTAVGAGDDARPLQRVMSTTLTAPGFGMSSFWVWHFISPDSADYEAAIFSLILL